MVRICCKHQTRDIQPPAPLWWGYAFICFFTDLFYISTSISTIVSSSFSLFLSLFLSMFLSFVCSVVLSFAVAFASLLSCTVPCCCLCAGCGAVLSSLNGTPLYWLICGCGGSAMGVLWDTVKPVTLDR